MSARIKPYKIRGRRLEEVREKDPDGRIVVHHRTVDTLGKMLRAGSTTPEMHDAAKDLEAAFIVANLDPLRALPIVRVPGNGREPDLNERQLHARWRVHKAMQALGGISSPAGSCVWHVVGLQRSVREWAMRQGRGGRAVPQEQAQASWSRRWACWQRTLAVGQQPEKLPHGRESLPPAEITLLQAGRESTIDTRRRERIDLRRRCNAQ